MIIIQDKLISEDLVEEYFHCNLAACKGACCWEGDWGAPLDKEELKIVDNILDKIKPYLSEESRQLLEEKGPYTFFPEMEKEGTTLHEDGSCVFLTRDKNGIAQCGIEQAYNAGDISYRKPISCHLYPIRVKKNEEVGFEALNYDWWHICSPACELGKKMKIPLYQFAKEAIIRAYGHDFYAELDAAAKYVKESSPNEQE